jgi:hypothetical protein
MGLWSIVEAVTGISRDDVKVYVRGRAVQFAKSITCKCGDLEWQHERGEGKCLRCGDCEQFETQHMPTAEKKETL